MANDADRGKRALENRDYPTAINLFTKALTTSQSPLWLIQRSTAYQRTGQHDLALVDADNAVLAAINRGKRELIAAGHMRRAVALHGLGRFGDARLCLVWCGKYNEKEKGLTIWSAKVKADYDKAGGETAECNQLTVKEVPEVVEEDSSDAAKDAKGNKTKDAKGNKTKDAKGNKTKDAKGKEPEVVVEELEGPKPKPMAPGLQQPAAVTQTAKEKVRHEWYQSPTTVTIEILAKGVPKDKAEVIFEQRSVSNLPPISCFEG